MNTTLFWLITYSNLVAITLKYVHTIHTIHACPLHEKQLAHEPFEMRLFPKPPYRRFQALWFRGANMLWVKWRDLEMIEENWEKCKHFMGIECGYNQWLSILIYILYHIFMMGSYGILWEFMSICWFMVIVCINIYNTHSMIR